MAITLTLGNSYSQLEGLDSDTYLAIKRLMSYEVDASATYYSGNPHTTRYLMDKRGNFPTGLLYIAAEYLDTNNLPYALKDHRKRPEAQGCDFTLSSHPTPYPQQIEGVDIAILRGRGTLSCVTGFGKSLMMALLIDRLKVKTLIVVPNLGLKRQLSESMLAWFGSLDHITIENIDSPNLEKANDYGCLIIDESHHVAAQSYRTLNKKAWGGIFYRFFFTGTPFRSRDEEQLLMESISGQVIYRVDYHQAVKLGAIVPIEAYYIEIPKSKVEGYTWAQVYSELVVKHGIRNDTITKLMLNLTLAHKSTLCVLKEIAHGEALSNGGAFIFVSGKDQTTKAQIDRFNARQLNTLIGTSGVLGEGIDTRPAEYVIIAGLGKSKNQFMQQVGRGLRKYEGKESAKIIIFKDRSHKWTKSHFKAQCKILVDEYGVEPVELKV